MELNENTKNILEEFLVDTISGINKVVEFSVEQIPDVLQQLLIWHCVHSAVVNIITILVVISSWYAYIRLYNYHVKKYGPMENADGTWIHFMVVGSIMLFFITTFAPLNLNLTWLKIWVAPKLYLLEYAANIIK